MNKMYLKILNYFIVFCQFNKSSFSNNHTILNKYTTYFIIEHINMGNYTKYV